ncbi:ParB N-terminal domain-containing protein [Kordiimonas aquimaris]|uniref:ParB N-terminal domain-containing protein n=1 Tax=Kordiimonas aquimaris TaxID=707591 RepID=UPI0021D01046|nr:ParB N-terminal domain-containing protein [Kordiimonas aquimaris]
MLKVTYEKIEDIYVPAARRQERDQGKVDAVIEDMLNEIEQKPIRVRRGKGRLVLIAGIHRLEASKALGEKEISAYITQAPKF